MVRVLHCPLIVGGNPQGLARAERTLGLKSRTVSFTRGPFGYECDEVLWTDPSAVIRNQIARCRLLWRAVRNFDVVHFNFGTPILPTSFRGVATNRKGTRGILNEAFGAYSRLVEFKDLALLRRLGKAIFVTYQGDDARQADYCLANFRINPVGEVDSGYYAPGSDEKKRRDIAAFDRYADGIYALNPDLLHVLPARARFLPYSHIDPREWRPSDRIPGTRSRPLVIHAPSHQGVKGTRHIVAAVGWLKSEGADFDFVIVENLPNAEARKLYAEADLVVDQLLVGWYGGLAVECMALGKPVICYIREEDLQVLEPEMRAQLPVIRAEPGNIYDVLKRFLTTELYRLPGIGISGRAYVERWHDPLRIARFLQEEYGTALERKRKARHRYAS